MKLDNKIINPLEIYSPVNAMLAKVYIGQNGIFSNDSQEFENLKNADLRVLTDLELREGYTKRFCSDGFWYEYFLPLANVEQKEYIPFKTTHDLAEAHLHLGCIINFVNTEFLDVIHRAMINEVTYDDNTNELIDITLGNTTYSFESLFNDYQFLDSNGKWVPFGKKIEE